MSNPTSGILDNYNLRFNWGTNQLEMNVGEEDWEPVPGTSGGTPAGSDTQVQFNDNGAFGASSDLTWDGATLSTLSLTTDTIASDSPLSIIVGSNNSNLDIYRGGDLVNPLMNIFLKNSAATLRLLNGGSLRLSNQGTTVFWDATESFSATLSAPTSVDADYNLFLPEAQGDPDTVLTNDGSGNLSWEPSGGGSSPNIVKGIFADLFDTTSSTPQATGLTVTITPSQTDAPILIMASGTLGIANSNSTEYAMATIYKNGTNVTTAPFTALTMGFYHTASQGSWPCSMHWLDTEAKTIGVAITYEVRIFNSDNGTTIRWGQADPVSVIIAQEIH